MHATEPPPPFDERLEHLRAAVAEAYDGAVFAGMLSVRTDVWYTRTGPWWHRRWTNPSWGFEWLIAYDEGYSAAHPEVLAFGGEFDDGVESDAVHGFQELLRDEFDIRGTVFRLTWIDPLTQPDVWTNQFAFGRVTTPPSS